MVLEYQEQDFYDEVLDDCDGLLEDAEKHPLDHVRWTPPQLAFLRSTRRFRLLRTGNQFGKTWAGVGEVIYRATGRHPYKKVRQGPIEAWLICKSWSQSIAIQAKLWKLLPKDAVVPGTKFSEKSGFAGDEKAVVFKNGSIIRIKTVGQDSLDLASATLHYVWIDEPLGDDVLFTELKMRLRRTAGHLAITMTPATSGNLSWLRTLVDEGQIEDLHFKMEAANFIPEGANEPLKIETEDGELIPMDEAWVQSEIEGTLAWQRGVRCHGEWEYALVGAAFEAFNRGRHVVKDLALSGFLPKHVELSTGIDYGEDALRTCGVLVYLDTSGEHPKLFVMSEYAPRQGTTIEMDADGLLDMLGRQGDRWADLDYAWADRKYEGRTTKKNAKLLEAAIAKKLALQGELRPSLQVAKRGLKREHLWPSVRWVHEAMLRPGHFYVDESCAWLIEALEKWDGEEKSIYKDVIDALRYACRHIWGARSGAPGKSRVLRRAW